MTPMQWTAQQGMQATFGIQPPKATRLNDSERLRIVRLDTSGPSESVREVADDGALTTIRNYAEFRVMASLGRTTQNEVTDAWLGVNKLLAHYGQHAWDANQIKQPGWHHVAQAFIDGAREARANADANEGIFQRAADTYSRRIFLSR